MAMGDLCVNHIVTVKAQDSIQQAAQAMQAKNIGSVVVMSGEHESQKPVGILTDRDIVLQVVASNKCPVNTKVEQVMCQDLLTIDHHQGIKEAIDLMRDKGVRRAPIMQEGKICGLVATDDLLILIAKEMNALADLVQKQIIE